MEGKRLGQPKRSNYLLCIRIHPLKIKIRNTSKLGEHTSYCALWDNSVRQDIT